MKSTHARTAIAALCLIVLGACGTSSGTKSTPAHTLSIEPSTATTRASGTPVNLVAQGNGITPATVAWSLSGPGSLNTNTGPSTLYTPPAEGSTTLTATVTARDGDLTATATITVEPRSGVTVNGRLLSEGGAPAASVPVMIVGHAPTSTDADGRFVVPGVETPYDLVIGGSPVEDHLKFAEVVGLTLPNPVISADAIDALTGSASEIRLHTSNISGTLAGGVEPPYPATVPTAFAFDGPTNPAVSGSVADDRGYDIQVDWDGDTTVSGTLHALQWTTDSAGLPTSYSGHASRQSLQISDGSDLASQDLALDPVQTDTLTATVARATPLQWVAARGFELHLGTGAISLGSEVAVAVPGLTSAIAFKTPHVAGATMQLAITAVTMLGISEQDAGFALAVRRNLATDAHDVAVALPASPLQSSPAKGATGIDATTNFTWTANAGLKIVQMSTAGGVQPAGDGASAQTYEYTIITAQTVANLPDLALLGVATPRGMEFEWIVGVVETVASSDEIASPDAAEQLRASDTLKFAVSPRWRFTTAP